MTGYHTTAYPFEGSSLVPWTWWEGGFSKEECESLIELGKSKELEFAKTGALEAPVDNIRKSQVSWIYPSDNFEVYQKLSAVVKNLNPEHYKFDLYGFVEGLQFTEYKEPDDHYTWHVDISFVGSITRKLTVVLQLSDPNDYEGGDLEISTGRFEDSCSQAKKEQGTVIVFPTFMMHRVAPVTKGTRYSLVGWITGPQFK